MTNNRGITVIEILLVAGITGILACSLAQFFSNNANFSSHMQVRQKLLMDSRACIETIMERLRSGKAGTVTIKTHSVGPVVPNSEINFTLHSPLPSGETLYSIYLENGSAYTLEGNPSNTPRLLAPNVTGLKFDYDAYAGVVKVTLRMDIPWDQTNDTARSASILLPNQIVHMMEKP